MKPGKLDLKKLKELLAFFQSENKNLIQGPAPGTDAAILKLAKEQVVFTSDPITFVTKFPALYLVNVNVNDLAVTGAEPEYLVLDALLPPSMDFEELKNLFQNISREANKLNIEVIGGHTEVTDAVNRPILVGTMFGRLKAQQLSPSRVKPGDWLIQVNPVPIEGTAILAIEHPRAGEILSKEELQKAKELLFKPGINILKPAKILWQFKGTKYMHDPTEGGIATAIYELAEALKMGFEVEKNKIMVLNEAVKLSRKLHFDPLGLISSGSILAVLDPKEAPDILATLNKNGYKACKIGTVIPNKKVFFKETAEPLPVYPQDELTKLL